MLIKMLEPFLQVYREGDVYAVPKSFGWALIAAGAAEAVDSAEPERKKTRRGETAMITPGETPED